MKYAKNRKTMKKTGGKKKPRTTKRKTVVKKGKKGQKIGTSKVRYVYVQQPVSHQQQLHMQQPNQQPNQQPEQPSTYGNFKSGVGLGLGVGVGQELVNQGVEYFQE
jgi:hypothetical protein